MLLPSLKIVEELLRDPFGPYYDHEVLSAECQTESRQTLVLESFQLAHNDKIIGLDDSEQPLGTGEVDNRVYRFRGILTIYRPSWLSEVGTKRVEGEFNLRASMRSMREGERSLPDMTLEQLFHTANGYQVTHKNLTSDDKQPKLKLKIQGFKNMPAVYMSSKQVPHGLLWSSKDKNRYYEVATMDVYTFQHSENFFWCHRLLTLMKKIVDEDPRRTSLQRRTPEWFVSQYIQRFSHPPGEDHERLIYDSDDSDILDDGTTHLPRHPRRIHKSDIMRLFAAQSEWIVTNSEARQIKWLPFKPWNRFRKMVKKARWQASRNDVIWGWPIGREHDPDLESEPSMEEVVGSDNDDNDDDDDDEMRAVVARNPVIGKTNEIVHRKIKKAKTRSSAMCIESSPSSSSSSDEADPRNVHAYISDFAEESSVTASDSADEGVDEHLNEFKPLVPPALFRIPDLPGPDSRWWCRIPGCDYMIDMQNLKQENVRGLSGDSVFYLMAKEWRSIREDKNALLCFRRMVSVHYKSHMECLGLDLAHSRGKVQVNWIKHGRHEPHRHTPQGIVAVKEEVD